MEITIVGGGSFGKAIAHILPNPRIAELERDGSYSNKTQQAISDADVLILAVPSEALKSCLKMIKPLVSDKAKIISCMKALYYKTDLHTPSMMIRRELDKDCAVLVGGNIAEEIRQDIPTKAWMAGPKWIEKIIPHFKTDNFVAVEGEDIMGLEFGAAAKNMLSITAGLIEGAYGKSSCNAKAATMAKMIEELKTTYRRISADKGKTRNIPSEPFLADVIATCTSEHSRNRTFGKQIGRKVKKKGVKEIYEQMGTVEGYDTTKAIYEYITDKHVYAPTIKSLYKVLYRKAKIATLTEWLKNEDT